MIIITHNNVIEWTNLWNTVREGVTPREDQISGLKFIWQPKQDMSI